MLYLPIYLIRGAVSRILLSSLSSYCKLNTIALLLSQETTMKSSLADTAVTGPRS
jgi:hypothetical protein